MKYIIILLALFLSVNGIAQKKRIIKKTQEYHASENEKFGNKETTILTEEDLAHFEALDFYAIDLKYRVEATFVRTPDEEPFLMPTTTDRLPEYVKYGEAHFSLEGKDLKLNLYQSTTPSEDEEYKDYLFLPFTDLTCGDGSYGGGRFLDAHIPKREKIVLNFNKAYNPYCAYNSRYSCPIPPKENDLLVRIEAGVKAFGDH